MSGAGGNAVPDIDVESFDLLMAAYSRDGGTKTLDGAFSGGGGNAMPAM